MLGLSDGSFNPKQALAHALREKDRRRSRNKLALYMPDEYIPAIGSVQEFFPRDRYPKHMDFFAASKEHRFIAFLAANRVGKTTCGCLALTYHLTGLYPDWWPGRKFDSPIQAWAVSDTAETTRNKLMKTLLYGEEYELGSGLIPADLIGRIAKPSGHIETVLVRHVTKGWSELGFKAYEQKRKSFQSVERHVILLDEEPQDIGIYSECVTRTATFNGLVMLTFTALCGVTPLVLKFMPELAGLKPDTESRARAVVICGWDDIPHLTPAQQKELEAEYQPHEIPARTKGIPDVSIGAVYPIPESVIKIDPFPIPDHWPRCFALDPGWEDPTAALWTAWDRETDIIYFYSEHYQKMKEPPIHASAIKARGAWIPGTGDYATDIKDGRSTLDVYRDEGLNITRCQKSDKDARVMDLLTRFSTGRARVFSTLTNFFMEYRMYHRDEKGNFCGPDHLMNCAEYTVQSGLKLAKTNIEANLDGADRPMWEKSFGL